MESRTEKSAENEYLMAHSKFLVPIAKRAYMQKQEKTKIGHIFILGAFLSICLVEYFAVSAISDPIH